MPPPISFDPKGPHISSLSGAAGALHCHIPDSQASNEVELAYKHIFGPVASRRLGRSLGVDLVPMKTCPFNCIYCEVGLTTTHTCTRAEYVNGDEILAELDDYFEQGGEADFITITGSGEPTLSLAMGHVIRECAGRFGVQVAVITNSALLWDPAVRKELAAADLVIPSLDAAREECFRAINRPTGCVSLKKLIDGLVTFSREFAGRLWLEVLLVEGVNDSDEDVSALLSVISQIAPDRVQINTVARPPAERGARAVAPARLDSIAQALWAAAPVEIIARPGVEAGAQAPSEPTAAILETLKRRPCTAADIAAGLSLPQPTVDEALAALVGEGLVESVMHDGEAFYQALTRRS